MENRGMIQYTEFKEQVVLITGAASGIGHAQTRRFLEQEAIVIGLDKQVETMAKLAEEYSTFSFYQLDVTDHEKMKVIVSEILEQGICIDYLVNTAGILDDYLPTLETSDTLWQRIMDTNVTAVFHLTNLVLPQMLKNKRGTIINTASIASLVAGGGGAAYTAAKHALAGYTKQLALDYAEDGIHVNAIAPGAIQTPMNAADFAGDAQMAKWVANETPLKRWAQPEEVADLTLFLASEASAYLQGAIVPIDGGWLLK
ncbi:3-oxoacyl-ACP reductase [Enterococcus larvae]|uniref:3-oxoacyl-ACP reductase n=1 Tax=Enterococcus larvae TaxID=2794352 RepID=UPI003F3BD55B